ncbi:hypothetical protein [Burkholderia ubonensis]|uniref:hypothetical protein n=1 Tax=Burkholderia ubonensis TaxID=101571 RepID=UPI000A67BA73|nr:hypothetical protein [Burkholderia ubonensis]
MWRGQNPLGQAWMWALDQLRAQLQLVDVTKPDAISNRALKRGYFVQQKNASVVHTNTFVNNHLHLY